MIAGSRQLRANASLWYGRIRDDWNVSRFKYIATIRNGQVDPEQAAYQDLPLFAPNHVEAGTGRLISVESAREQGAESGKYLVEAGELVYSKIRPALRKVIVAPFRGLCSADMYPVKPAASLTAPFLFYAMLGDGFWRYTLLESDRVAMPKINREALAECVFAYPGVELQVRIAASLDRKTAAIDALIAKKERLIELLQEKRQALITQAVTKGLDPTVPMKDSGVEWLGAVPAHWSVKMLNFFATFQRGHDLPSDDRREGSYAVVSSGGRIGTHDTFAARGPGIVTGRYGSIGQFHLVPENYWPLNTALYTTQLWGNEPRFAFFALSCLRPLFLMESKKAAVPGIDRNDLHVYNVAVPPVQEQRRIVEHLSRLINQIDSVSLASTTSVEKLREYRQALITAAVTGQLDVSAETSEAA